MRQGFLRDLRSYSVSIFPPILHSHIHLNAAKVLSEGKRAMLGTSHKAVPLLTPGACDRQGHTYIFFYIGS